MNQSSQETLEMLLSPISEEHPEGKDLAYSGLFEAIKEAGRADDPALPQGEWETALKVADWGKVRRLCEEGLLEHGKDIQLAVWYADALARLDGFAGAAFGLRLTGELLRRFRERLYPRDPDERIGKLEWLNLQLGAALRQVPLTKREQGGYGWLRWQESREVENLRRQGGKGYEHAVADGKLAADAFDKSARESGAAWYRKLFEELAEARAAHDELLRVIGESFGEDAPSLAGIRDALDACQSVVQRMSELCGGSLGTVASSTLPLAAATENRHSLNAPSLSVVSAADTMAGRDNAIRQLREIARYFRESEPHSPVALLLERAAKWAEMPLEHWLKSVIKDKATLAQLNELLDLSPD